MKYSKLLAAIFDAYYADNTSNQRCRPTNLLEKDICFNYCLLQYSL